ncbi:monovalent cation/proton antiporter, MnhG/PhaG subunit [Devosia crocina]|uniref:Monovalent cation/proton antiporter, MnhG/PhaG subunit n=1 Tax=Devosia crocina TaxID=429728 RepID=A0A1I7NRT5_9HYPH|nr:monovalent cation/H(+) antiporter subunit G [Devosia crocina]SFV37308.1 monovalent cation/proton antiporter, MnhG/PhaG subunit [Devosia crocina]
MTLVFHILALVLVVLGVVFIFAAAVGVSRFPDALQRMHASTKAGTLGAILILGGAMAALGSEAAAVGTMAMLFMLLTVPVAAHLLGRAAYVSGAPLRLVVGTNALLGVLQRQDVPLEERTEFVAYAPGPAPVVVPEPADESLPPLSDVRLALIAPDIAPVLSRALAIRNANKVPLKAIAVVDDAFLQATGDPQGARLKVRENVAKAIEEMETLLPKKRSFFTLSYEEGDPMRLIPAREDLGSLLVLPWQGWCHHGVELATPMATGRPEGLLRLADHHAGGTLYLGRKDKATDPVVAVADDGGDAILAGTEWALRAGLWSSPQLLLVGVGTTARRELFAALVAEHDARLVDKYCQMAAGAKLPPEAAGADALITATLPRPKRADWYGMHWHQSIAPNWAGEVLVVPSGAERR